MKIQKGDMVKVISGKDAGKEGKVLQAFPKKGTVLVEGVNVNKKHQKPQGQTCLLYTSPSPRDLSTSRMPSSA